MTPIFLPVSGIELSVRDLTGEDELHVLESRTIDVRLAVGLAASLTNDIAGETINWSEIPATDLDAFYLLLRSSWLGDRVLSDTTCESSDCIARVDIEFGIAEYLEHYRGRLPNGVEVDRCSGWHHFLNSDVGFRVPNIGDLLAAIGQPNAAGFIAERCIRPFPSVQKERRKIENAIETMAPWLANSLTGHCPECGTSVSVLFDPQVFVLNEIKNMAAFIYEDICKIAGKFGWPESEILRLPSKRRIKYTSALQELQQ